MNNSILTARVLAERHTFASRQWFYEFRELSSTFDETACKRVADRMLQRYALLTKAWTAEANSEWTCRLFMAAKLILVATLQVNSTHFAEDRNLRVVVPYLRYYATLSLLRAICCTLPDLDWDDGNLLRISHSSAIKGSFAHIGKFSKTVAESAETTIRRLKAERELISYRAPSSGDDKVSENNDFLWLCTMLSEIAQFNSELFEASLFKNGEPSSFQLLPEYLNKISGIEIDGHYFGDCEDAYRLGYLARKYPLPANLMHLMTQGHVEDFFGAWYGGDDKSLFNPDDMQQIIFDIP
jgi:hypothetical protein